MTLEKTKIGKMIKDYLAGKLELPQKAFKTLCLTFNSLNEQKIYTTPIVRIGPPKTLNPPKLRIKKDGKMSACINEMHTNELFLQMQIICEY